MDTKPKKPSRQKTLARLEAVSDEAVGTHTALDAAFAAFEKTDPDDAAAMAQAQSVLRALLAEGLVAQPAKSIKTALQDDTPALGKPKCT